MLAPSRLGGGLGRCLLNCFETQSQNFAGVAYQPAPDMFWIAISRSNTMPIQ